MKTKFYLPFCLLFTIPHFSNAQTTQTITYDTVVTGTGNGFYTFSFPKFNPQLGTLTDIRISTNVVVNYSYTLENKELITIPNYRVRVAREDEISSTALMLPLTNMFQKTYGPFLLTAADASNGSGTDYFNSGPLTVMDHQVQNYTLYNAADFMGTGTVSFDYLPMTYTIIFGGATYNFQGNSSDLTRFSITYTYSSSTFLASGINFSAQKKNDNSIELNWTTTNETNDRRYELQKSTDGKQFVEVTRFNANAGNNQVGTYHYNYPINSTEQSRLLFRVKQIEKNGTVNYSPLRIIDLGKSTTTAARLYPNPSTGATQLLFSNSKRDNWKVEVYTTNGQLVNTYYFKNALLAKLNTNNEWSKGVYMVKATNTSTAQTIVQKLAIQ